MTKVCITGGSGFLGTHILNLLLSDNSIEEVRVITRGGSNLRQINNPKLTVKIVDWSKPKLVEQALEGSSTVIHCAANHPTRKDVKNFAVLDDNLQLAKSILVSLKSPVHLVLVSSMRSLVNDSGKLINEASKYNFAENDTAYGLSKHLVDELALLWAEMAGASKLSIVYPGIIIGPDDHMPSPNGMDFLKVMKNRLNFYIDSIYPIVDVRDVARAIVRSIKSTDQSSKVSRYILCSCNLPMDQYYKLIKGAQGKSTVMFKIPLVVAKMASIFFRVASVLSPKLVPPVTDESLAYAKLKLEFDGSNAERVFGKYIDIEKTILDTVNFYENNTN